MAEGDSIRFEATFENLDEAVRLFTQQLSEQLAKAEAMGEEAMASIIRSQIQRTAGPAAGEGVQGEATALERVNALRRQGTQLDLEMLDAIREQNAALEQQAVLTERLQREPAAIALPPERRAYTSYSETAGQQAAVERELAETQAYVNEMVNAEGAGRARLIELEQQQYAAAQKLAEQQARLAELQASPAHQWDVAAGSQAAYDAGRAAASRGSMVPTSARAALTTGPGAQGEGWTASEQKLARYNLALGEYQRFNEEASLSTESLTANLTRLGIADSEASNALRQHGALTTEYLSALARGETTVGEFGYQIGATVAKFAGWTVAATATYAALGAVTEFGKGAIDASSGVQMLTRTIDNLNRQQASTGLQDLSQQVNVPISEASSAVFQFSRTFHELPDAIAAARLGLSAFKLDNVSLTDSVKASTVLNQQFGVSAQGLSNVYNMLSAGQREYNARISDMIPLLQKSSGAVKNAGGDLTTLTQLGIYAQRTTQLGGSQIGTAFYRSAATFLNPSTTKGASDREILRSLGINPDQKWTQVFVDALTKSLTLSSADRTKLANAMFGPQYGGRLAALFNPTAVPEFTQHIARTITPAATQGSLQTELQRQLHTSGEELHSFTNELQRMGAALAETGVISGGTTALRGVVDVLDAVRQITDAFDGLPGPVKEAVIGIEAITAALLFMSRTRFGSSLADATRLSRIPGVGASAAQRATFDLRVGTRAAQDTVGQDIASQLARSKSLAAQEAAIGEQRAQLETEIAASDGDTTAAMEQSSRYAVQMKALAAERAQVEADLAASYKLQGALQEQQTMLRKPARRGGYTDAQRLQLAGAVGVGTNAAEDAATTADTAAQSRLAGAKARLAGLLRLNAAASEEAAGAMASDAEAAATATTATTAAETESVASAGVLSRMGTRLTGLASAIDPMLAAMILIPVALGEVQSVIDHLNKATDAAAVAVKAPVTGVQSLQNAAAALRQASAAQAKGDISGGPLGILQNAAKGWGSIIGGSGGAKLQDWATGRNVGAAQKNDETASALQALSGLWGAAGAQFQKDGEALAGTQAGRQQLGVMARTLEQRMKSALSSSGLSPQEVSQIYTAFVGGINYQYQQLVNAAAGKGSSAKSPGGLLAQFQTDLSAQPTVLETELQSYDDFQKIFGQNNQKLNSALVGFAALASQAAKPANATNDTLFQQVGTAQSNITSSITTMTQSALREAEVAKTNQGQMSALTQALGSITNAQAQIGKMSEQFKNQPAIVKALGQLSGLVADQGRQIQQQLLSDLKSQLDVHVASIIGISPEAGVQRAQASLNELKTQLSFATSHGFDASTINTLQAQLYSAEQTLLQDQVTNAQNLVQAQAQLAQSQITGVSPVNDLQRAQASVEGARQQLAFAQTHGQGEAAIIQAQANLDAQVYALNQAMIAYAQQVQQDSQAMITAQGSLQQAQTLNPIEQAKEQLNEDTKLLGTIRPSAYKTFQEYQAAVVAQQAKVAQDQRNVTSSIVSTQMATLQFQFDTQRISSQQYINGLQGLLKLHKLTLQQTQSIEQEIYNVAHSTAVNLNAGNISLPTTYEVRRALQSAIRGGATSQAGQSAVVQNNHVENHINVQVNGVSAGDLKKVSDAIGKGVNTNVSLAQASGLI